MFYDCQLEWDIYKCLNCGMNAKTIASRASSYFCSDECYYEAKKKVKKLVPSGGDHVRKDG